MKPVDPRVVPLLAPARSALAAVVASGVVGGGLVLAQAFAVAELVTRILDAPGSGRWHAAAWWLVGITLARAAIGTVGDLAANRAAGQVTRSLRSKVLRAALDLGLPGLSGRRSGELGLLATRGVAAVEPYLTRFVPTLVVACVLPPATVALILGQDLWAGVIVVSTLPLVPLFAVLIGLATRDRADRQYRTLSQLAGHFVDVVRGLPTLVTFNRAEAQSARIRAVTDRYRRATLDTLRLAFASSGALELIATLSVALVAVSVGLRLASGGLDLRTALVVLLLAPEAYWPLRRVGAEFHAAAEGVATLVAVTELLEESREPAATRVPSSREHEFAALDPVPIHVRDLAVSWPGSARPALVLPEATIPAPGLTAIVGPSGCGKSTLVQALLGELPVDRGSITLAGEPVDPVAWRHLVAQVPQTPWLTAGTIGDNVRIGRPSAADHDVWKALAAVGLQDVVAALPENLHTPLGEDGAGLSAGQRARLALARVVLADRPYVVLDEPTAHLDADTEEVMLAALTRLAQHATVVVVAHRPAVVRAADHIVVVSDPGVDTAVDPDPLLHDAPVVSDRAPAEHTSDSETGVAPPRARRRFALATVLATGASVSGVALTATAGWLIAKSAQHPPVLTLMVAIVAVRTFGLARPALRYAERLVSHDAALRKLADTRARVYDVLVPLSPARLGRHRGDLLTSVVDDVDAELDERLRVRQPVVAAAGTSVVAVLVAALVHPVSAVPLVAVALLGALALVLADHGARRGEADFVTRRAALSAEVLATLQSARQLVLWDADGAALARVDGIGRGLAGARRRTATALAGARALLLAGCGLAVVAVAALTDAGLAAGAVSGPMAALLVLLPLALHDVLAVLPEAGVTAVRTRAARERLDALERLTPAVLEPASPVPVTADPVEVRLEDAALGWTERAVVADVDLQVPPGRAVGIVGPSGSGKSTIAATLVRHLAPLAGRYRVGGHDAGAVGSAEVRRHVGLVDDDPYVFGSTLRENLRLAAPSADDRALVAAVRAAGLGTWYAGLVDGLDTFLGDGGTGVSGGERARLGIARALLADPDVLVLDEPTAHLDSATARTVAETVLASRERAQGRRSLVWITHDEVGLDRMDDVLELADGLTPAALSDDLGRYVAER